jgi:predicted AAA+ superfamily ATPase
MERLTDLFLQKLNSTKLEFVRSIMREINWEARLVGIKGARGVGKTTLLLQYIKQHLKPQLQHTLYVSLDAFWFNYPSIYELADEFVKKGGQYLFLDEVHKYQNWALELKNIYDDFPSLKVVFTGSSLLEILNARADLSRRAVIYTMQGLSFREYLSMETKVSFESYTLDDILINHQSISAEINEEVKVFQYFETYLKSGHYPFYKENRKLYYSRLGEVVNMILDIELPQLRQIEVAYIPKLKQLLAIIAKSVPFKPNVSKLSSKIVLNRQTLLSYLNYLDEVDLTTHLYKSNFGISQLQKPDKIYLDNTNLMYLLGESQTNSGNLRETFFVNQMKYRHQLAYTEKGDFLVDDTYTFEIGGKDKSQHQIQHIKNAYIASDGIIYGSLNKIPLWMFGFLY